MNEHLLDGVLVRSAIYLALAISSGPMWWGWLVTRQRVPVSRWRWITTAVLVGFAIIVGIVQATLAFAETWSFAAALQVLRDTSYGRVLTVHTAVVLAHAVAFALGLRMLAVASAIAATVTITLLGHAAVQSDVHVVVQVAHAAAAIAWLGGLVVMIERIAKRSIALAELQRFSRLALPLVVVLAATGVARAASFVPGGARELGWISVLVVKLVFFAGALVLANGHRRSGFQGRRFHTRLTLEMWLVACALQLATLLSQLPPP